MTIISSTNTLLSFVASNGVVLATENKHKSILYEEHSVHKVEMITEHIGMVYSGEYSYWN
jgi:20S proteasome subunit alpha 2